MSRLALVPGITQADLSALGAVGLRTVDDVKNLTAEVLAEGKVHFRIVI